MRSLQVKSWPFEGRFRGRRSRPWSFVWSDREGSQAQMTTSSGARTPGACQCCFSDEVVGMGLGSDGILVTAYDRGIMTAWIRPVIPTPLYLYLPPLSGPGEVHLPSGR